MMPKRGKPFSVDTQPTKEVVVDSLTRDISVEACIFDLIDNAIDAARDTIYGKGEVLRSEPPGSYAGFRISLSLSSDSFSIEDNCGGIPVHRLKTMVLRFGQRSSHDMGIGIFGLGLNRALFKLGRVSHLKTDTGSQRAELVLNTDKYLKSDDWNLPAEEFKTSRKVGTTIEISQIPGDIARSFADADKVGELRRNIGRRYGRFIQKGLEIEVNGEDVQDGEVQIRENSPFEEGYKFYKTDDGVTIHIRFGQHKDHRFSAEPDYDKERNRSLTEQFGWTILCNDRAIVISDQTWKTGWDAKFHTEFYGFVGVVSFNAKDPAKLPWDTTKSDVNLNNPAYQTALVDMRSFTEKWRTNATHAKGVRRRKEVLLPTPGAGVSTSSETQQANPKPPSINGKSLQNPPATKVKKPTIKKDHNQFGTILPDDIDERHCFDKHLALVHEAKILNLNSLTYSGMSLIRSLFEATVVTYLERHGKSAEFKQFAVDRRHQAGGKISDEKKVAPDTEEMIAFLENNPEIWGAAKHNHLRHSLRKMAAHKKLLNSAVHNPYQTINRSQAFAIRDEVLPILRHLIET